MEDYTKQNENIGDQLFNSKEKKSFLISIIIAASITSIIIVAFSLIYTGLFYSVDINEWVVKETVKRETTIEKEIGIYYKGFSKIYKYPVKKVFWYDREETIKITFADRVSAMVEIHVSVEMPKEESVRLSMHWFIRQNESTLKDEIGKEIRKYINNTATTMTGKESLDSNYIRKITENLSTIGIYGKTKTFIEAFDIKILDGYIFDIRYDALFIKIMEQQNISKQLILRAEYELELAEIERERARAKAETKALRNIPVE